MLHGSGGGRERSGALLLLVLHVVNRFSPTGPESEQGGTGVRDGGHRPQYVGWLEVAAKLTGRTIGAEGQLPPPPSVATVPLWPLRTPAAQAPAVSMFFVTTSSVRCSSSVGLNSMTSVPA